MENVMRNYIDFLTKKDIINILEQSSYILCEDLYDNNGKKINPIQRTDKYIIVRCRHSNKNNIDTNILQTIIKALPSNSFVADFYNRFFDNEIICMENFFIQKWSYPEPSEEFAKKFFNKYHLYMIKKFGDEYKKDFKKYKEQLKDADDDLTL